MLQLTNSPTKDPEAALAQFAQQQGVRMGPPADLVPDLRSASARFEADTESGPVTGYVTFVALDKNTLQLIGITASERFGAQGDVLAQSQSSFEPVTDPKLLDVQPARIELIDVKRPMRLSQLYEQHRTKVPIEAIAALNQLDGDPQLKRGQTLKWVKGGSGQ